MTESSRRGGRSVAMWTLVAIPFTCWLCALVALPRRPRLGNEVEELVYTRLLGRQQRLVLLAVVASAAFLLVLLLGLPPRAMSQPALAGTTPTPGSTQPRWVACVQPDVDISPCLRP
jgi:hypothetical protein